MPSGLVEMLAELTAPISKVVTHSVYQHVGMKPFLHLTDYNGNASVLPLEPGKPLLGYRLVPPSRARDKKAYNGILYYAKEPDSLHKIVERDSLIFLKARARFGNFAPFSARGEVI